ncbi:type III pantothenate kinase [Gallaecimonas xiamenensis]|uniref:Type III pantothenate kinase n=1 Tax=Gallaecimonas xiamenensis 3-C-1 TaxID=745411 RepID=K2JPQ1_9GAMM|nr:type III pantothenate kinase [Gallaecimonas xiamenensis]EKE67200.1 hypothetical protein B3C1_19103 [Gallaecimonas xiamenensis 3-C-1]
MTALLVEVGNSYLKAALGTQDGIRPLGRFAHEELDMLTALLPRNLEQLLFASVSQEGVAEALHRFAERQGLRCQRVISEAEAFGLRSAYGEPWRLGVDRWLAMLAGFHSTKGACLVLDIGTAATADLVAANGQHLGGWIAPGFRMMTQAVLSGTAKVADLASGEGELVFGPNTGLGLHHGCQAMVSGFVKEAVLLAEQQLGQRPAVLLTGGGLRHLPPSLLAQGEVRTDLVLEGLALYC